MTKIDFDHHLTGQQADLRPYALSLTKDPIDAMDLCQDTILKALQYRNKFQMGTNLKAWLYTIMRNTFINTYRRNKRYRITEYNMNGPQEYAHSQVVQNGGWHALTLKEIKGAIYELPTQYRVAFELYYEGYKYAEIADVLKKPIGTIKSRIHIARKLLTKQLQD